MNIFIGVKQLSLLRPRSCMPLISHVPAASLKSYFSTTSATFTSTHTSKQDSVQSEWETVSDDTFTKAQETMQHSGRSWKSKSNSSGSKKPFTGPNTMLRRVLHIRRVAHVNSGGKQRSISVLAVVGNQNGSAGYGMGRALDSGAAMRKALVLAEKNMIHFNRLDNRTIFADLEHTYHKTVLQLRTASPGYGLMVNRNIHEVCRCIGITDLSGKVRGSLNPMNVIKATFDALSTQKNPSEIAKIRGKKVVDIQLAYYGTKL
ncbi:28S ribosomal protein S5, mitochondrial [Batrachochytrium dendrobatidis]|nr:28S ribosomal protein S5, mitochondrial [Batrachochytrium dendrobatidis]